MTSIGTIQRIVQVHPSRWCNLSCLHCYSSSGPAQSAKLPPELLCAAIEDAAAEGYTWVSISGGEPLMYGGLLRLLDTARSLGMGTSLVTNGILLDTRRIESLATRLDLMAISIDGRPVLHDRIRRCEGAFERMASRLPHLRRAGIPFGFVFMLSHDSFDDLVWALDFAVEQGARVFQIHPLAEMGRAAVHLRGHGTPRPEALAAWLAAQHLAKAYEDRILVTIDLARTAAIPAEIPELLGQAEPVAGRLSQAVSPLVIEDDGTVVPLEYGIARKYALGSLRRARLSELAPRWLADPSGYEQLRTLCRSTLAQVQAQGVEILTWYQEVSRSASTGSATVAPVPVEALAMPPVHGKPESPSPSPSP